ncbi:hypothetical protein GCM10023149_13910 [Mucilaginibacter gynuensis]|uniref:Acyltransferase 3 domain-containing protein n=2 Tax=Mucilaginibacter gynuensis TaxID=1302236 RepID=A0ABP8G3S2_9SPHI
MVLLGHCADTIGPIVTDNSAFPFFANARLGVRIFFVISGYLITKILITERDKTGGINLRNFYIRRAFRIFPVFYLYIITLIVLKNFFIPELFESYEWIGFASVFLWNYAHWFIVPKATNGNVVWFFGHFWTLSMEEQFYLLWPITFIKLNVSTLKKLVIGIIIAAPVVRLATYYFMPDSRGQIEMMLHSGGSIILMGCLGALIENTAFFRDKVMKLVNNTALIAFIGLFVFVISPMLDHRFQGAYKLPIGANLESLLIMILIFWSIYVPSKVAVFLNSKIITHIGVLSYSLYIWQQLFLNNKIDYWFNQFPQNICLVIVVAHISYYLIEMPFLNQKNRFIRKPKPLVVASV